MEFKIRPWTFEDVESLAQHANNYNIAKYMRDIFPHPYTLEHAKQFIAIATKDEPLHSFAIEVAGKAVGGIGFHLQTDVRCKNAELGYWLGEAYWGKGIMSKAILQIIELAFNTYPIHRLYAVAFGNNPVSQRVLEKTGFGLEAKFEKTIFKYEEYLDEWIYAIRR